MANSSYITLLKRLVKNEIVNDKLIVKTLGSPNYDSSDLDFSAEDVGENCIFTWNQNPSTIKEEITFLTLQVHITAYREKWVKPTLEIWIYSNNGHMNLKSSDFPGISANRNDYLSQLLDDKFNGRSSLGGVNDVDKLNLMGELKLMSNIEGVYNQDFVYRRMIFETRDINNSMCNRGVMSIEGVIYDELQIYRGGNLFIKDGIIIHQPTLDEICTYGEKEYWSLIYSFVSTGADLKFQLYDLGIDYTAIGDFELFYSILCRGLDKNKTSIIFGDLDFSHFKVGQRIDTDDIVLYDPETSMIIDEYTYLVIADVLRKMHDLKRNNQNPGNETTKQILIEDARAEFERNKNKEYRSQLKNLISAMVNCEGFKYSHTDVWHMSITAFLDSVKRISKIKNAGLLLQSGYSGYGINLQDISNDKLDWLGELD